MNNTLKTKELAVGYKDSVIIDNIDLEFEKGSITTLIGPNGAGKSTLLKTIARQLEPVHGKVYLGQKELREWQPKELAKEVSVLLTDRVCPELTSCAEIVAMGRYPYTDLFGRLTDEDERAVWEALELVNASELAQRDFASLSDGQRQRVLLARAICQQPQLLILDEPTAYLDIKHKLELLALLRDLAKSKGTTVIMSLHEVELAIKVSDKLLSLKDGRVAAFGPPEEIVKNHGIEKLFDLEGLDYERLFRRPVSPEKVLDLSCSGMEIPRVLIAGTGSDCGKTTISCAIMQAMVNRGLKVAAFKCGPDYIDPMFHSSITGGRSSNLDSFFFDDDTLRYLLRKNSSGCDISVIEGVMGYYDGLGFDSTKASSYEIAQKTNSPVILCIDAKGAALSVLAAIEGFLDFMPDNNICGVIFNRCTKMSYSLLKKEVDRRFGARLRPLGYLPPMLDCSIESRRLGLVTAAELDSLRDKLQRLSRQAEESIELDGIAKLAQAAQPVKETTIALPNFNEKLRIAVARDRAFCFYYEDSLDMLRDMGAELVPFSPIEEEKLPDNIHGLYLGGGYPELYAEALSENRSMCASIKSALEKSLPCIAECGGFMYLGEAIGDFPMVGWLPGKSFDTGNLKRFGYVNLKADRDNLLCMSGEQIAAHEFHYWDSENPGSDFTATKASGKSWACVHTSGSLYAGYPHFHFLSNIKFAENFYKACLEVKHRND